MSIQVSTRIDASTKEQFEKVCARMGLSPSSAMSLFIRGVINYNGIPFQITANRPSLSSTRQQSSAPTLRPPFPFGCMKGKIWVADDFDSELEDFKEYIE